MRRQLKEEGKFNSYILVMKVNKDIFLRIGKLGNLKFKKGKYIYVGSARRNLLTRIRRHINKNKKLFWHIDYLTTHPAVSISKIGISNAGECNLADILTKRSKVISRFGCSDCKCQGHLFKYEGKISFPEGVRILWL